MTTNATSPDGRDPFSLARDPAVGGSDSELVRLYQFWAEHVRDVKAVERRYGAADAAHKAACAAGAPASEIRALLKRCREFEDALNDLDRRVFEIDVQIGKTPAEGLLGLAIKARVGAYGFRIPCAAGVDCDMEGHAHDSNDRFFDRLWRDTERLAHLYPPAEDNATVTGLASARLRDLEHGGETP